MTICTHVAKNSGLSVLPNTYLWTNCRPTAVIFPTERHSNLLWQSERGTVWCSADHTSLRLCVWSGWRQRAGETRALLQPLSSLRHFYTMPSTARRCTYKGTNRGSKSSLKACAMQKPVLLDTMYKTACLYSALHVERCEEMHFIKSWMHIVWMHMQTWTYVMMTYIGWRSVFISSRGTIKIHSRPVIMKHDCSFNLSLGFEMP